jgi:hypothetical protein
VSRGFAFLEQGELFSKGQILGHPGDTRGKGTPGNPQLSAQGLFYVVASCSVTVDDATERRYPQAKKPRRSFPEEASSAVISWLRTVGGTALIS